MIFGKIFLAAAFAILANCAVVEIFLDEHCKHYWSTHNVEYNDNHVHTHGFQSFRIIKDGNHADHQYITAWSGPKGGGNANAVVKATDLRECVTAIDPIKYINYGNNSLCSGKH